MLLGKSSFKCFSLTITFMWTAGALLSLSSSFICFLLIFMKNLSSNVFSILLTCKYNRKDDTFHMLLAWAVFTDRQDLVGIFFLDKMWKSLRKIILVFLLCKPSWIFGSMLSDEYCFIAIAHFFLFSLQ